MLVRTRKFGYNGLANWLLGACDNTDEAVLEDILASNLD